MSLILGIDTSSTELGLGLYRDGNAVAAYSRYLRHSHAEHITRAVFALLDGCGQTPGDVTHIAISSGPGSFTGLRIGMAFAKGFCASGGVTVLPVSSLLVLAHGAGVAGYDGPIVTAIDARREEVFCARFYCRNNHLIRETEDALMPLESFRSLVCANDRIVTDTMGFCRSTAFQFLAEHSGHIPVERHPFARGLCCAAYGAERTDDGSIWQTAADLLPRYLRPFTAPYSKKATA